MRLLEHLSRRTLGSPRGAAVNLLIAVCALSCPNVFLYEHALSVGALHKKPL